ncbi:MyTH4 domain - like 2 [Theobroma cacao]|nr:MyTH4 domain - like 2 [Theobroma cacao]
MFHIYTFKYMGVDSSERGAELRDGLFAQISKQTTYNPDRQNLIKAWEVMYLCASSAPPSKDMRA